MSDYVDPDTLFTRRSRLDWPFTLVILTLLILLCIGACDVRAQLGTMPDLHIFAPKGIRVGSTNTVESAGSMKYDPAIGAMRVHDGTNWVIQASSNDLTSATGSIYTVLSAEIDSDVTTATGALHTVISAEIDSDVLALATNLNADNIVSGTLNDDRLSSNVPLMDEAAQILDQWTFNNDGFNDPGNSAVFVDGFQIGWAPTNIINVWSPAAGTPTNGVYAGDLWFETSTDQWYVLDTDGTTWKKLLDSGHISDLVQPYSTNLDALATSDGSSLTNIPTTGIQDWTNAVQAAQTNDGYEADTTLNLAGAETIVGDWVNTNNPWADNEVSDTLTIGAGSTIGAVDGSAVTNLSAAALPSNVAFLNSNQQFTANNEFREGDVILESADNGETDIDFTFTGGVGYIMSFINNGGSPAGSGSLSFLPAAGNGTSADGWVFGGDEGFHVAVSEHISLNPTAGKVLLGNLVFDADQTVGAGQDNYVLTYDNAGGEISLEAAAGGGGGGNPVDSRAVTNNINLATYSITNGAFVGNGGSLTNLNSDNMVMPRVAGSTYSTVSEMQSIFHSSGLSSGGTITDAGGGNVDVAAGTGFIRATDSDVAEIKFFDWGASAGNAIPSDTTRYVGVEWNAGTPQVVIKTSYDWDLNTEFPLGLVVNEGGTLYIVNGGQRVGDHAGLMLRRSYETMPKARDNRTGGLILGESGTRNVTLTAGALWERLQRFAISAIDTSASGSFTRYYQDGVGGWTKETTQTQWPNTQYDDGTGTLNTLANNRYASCWFYVDLNGSIYMVYGRESNTSLAAAEDETMPSTLPDLLSKEGKIVGRIIFQKDGATATSIETAFDTSFSSGAVSDHGNLAGLSDPDHPQYVATNDTNYVDYDDMATGYAPDDRYVITSATNSTIDASNGPYQQITVAHTIDFQYAGSTNFWEVNLLCINCNTSLTWNVGNWVSGTQGTIDSPKEAVYIAGSNTTATIAFELDQDL